MTLDYLMWAETGQVGRALWETLDIVSERALRWLGCSAMRLLTSIALDMDVQWHAPLPPGPKILAPNHPTTTDPFYVLTLTSEPMSVLVTSAAFKVPVFGRYLIEAGHIPAVCGSRGATVEALRRRIDAGHTVAIFPEGALSPLQGGLHPAHSGAARLAMSTGVPIIPVGIGLDRRHIWPFEPKIGGQTEEGRLYLRGPYALTVGEPVRFDGDPQDQGRVQAVSEKIMRHIADLACESEGRVQERLTYHCSRSTITSSTAGLLAAKARSRAGRTSSGLVIHSA
jgi:1-acyl-sn-glycerol-3-phosphate acyltransferase